MISLFIQIKTQHETRLIWRDSLVLIKKNSRLVYSSAEELARASENKRHDKAGSFISNALSLAEDKITELTNIYKYIYIYIYIEC